jgi:hypothetical protein
VGSSHISDMKIQCLYCFGASILCVHLQFWSLGYVNNTIIMHNESELMSESIANYRSSVLSVLKSKCACDQSQSLGLEPLT